MVSRVCSKGSMQCARSGDCSDRSFGSAAIRFLWIRFIPRSEEVRVMACYALLEVASAANFLSTMGTCQAVTRAAVSMVGGRPLT